MILLSSCGVAGSGVCDGDALAGASSAQEAEVFVNMVEMSHESFLSESLRPRLKRRQPRRQRRKARMAATMIYQ